MHRFAPAGRLFFAVSLSQKRPHYRSRRKNRGLSFFQKSPRFCSVLCIVEAFFQAPVAAFSRSEERGSVSLFACSFSAIMRALASISLMRFS